MNTVLLLYHCRRLRHELCTILAGKYRVIAAHGTGAAERLFRRRKPDLILMDYDGNNGDATAVLGRLRSYHPQTPVIALSRFDAPHGARVARQLGARAVVRWPGPVKRLLEAIVTTAGLGSDVADKPLQTAETGVGGGDDGSRRRGQGRSRILREEVRQFRHLTYER
ncbi:MAG: response regulator [Planctomycetes bacterium]|nr:response regulator [Planctomycetota bacterium]